jgi:hypothetical protein
MNIDKEAEIRAAAMIYFNSRAIPFEDTLKMSLGEIIAVWEYLKPQRRIFA